MATAFSDITEAIIATLRADPAILPAAAIFRARERAVPDKMEQAINVQWVRGDPDPGAIHGAPVDWQSTVIVECYASSVTESGDQAIDPLLEKVYDRLAGDTTLGGLVDDLGVPALAAEFGVEAKKTGWVQMTYVVKHQTTNLKLSS